MVTKNHRVAGYLPSLVYEKFQQFKSDREFGDSQALIHIFSEYFGVSQSVSYHDSPEVLERIKALESALILVQEELAKLKLRGVADLGESVSESLSELSDLAVGQLSFLDEPVTVEPPEDLQTSELNGHVVEGVDGWVSMKTAWADLGSPGGFDTFRKRTPDQLREMHGLEIFSYSTGKYKRHLARRIAGGVSSDDF
jgi:hypothetical protein